MAKPNQRAAIKNSHARQNMFLQDHVVDEIRIKQIADKSAVDYDRVSLLLRELTGQDISKELLKSSWDLIRVLLAEAVELRDRVMMMHIINEIIKRKEPKQSQIKTEGVVDHKVMVLVQQFEDKTLEDLIARRESITVREGEARPVGAISDRRGSGKKRS
jgi:predicted XRE-type DNA-binding protein